MLLHVTDGKDGLHVQDTDVEVHAPLQSSSLCSFYAALQKILHAHAHGCGLLYIVK